MWFIYVVAIAIHTILSVLGQLHAEVVVHSFVACDCDYCKLTFVSSIVFVTSENMDLKMFNVFTFYSAVSRGISRVELLICLLWCLSGCP